MPDHRQPRGPRPAHEPCHVATLALARRFALCLALACAGPALAGASAPASASAPGAIAPDSARAAQGGGPQFFLSWGRPWGEEGAEPLRTATCGDTTRADTLFLCLRPGVDMPSLVAFTADLRFHSEPPETLGTFWHFERGAANQSGLSVRFQPAEGEAGWVQPWRTAGNGGVGWTRTRRSGLLRMIYAVPPRDSVPLRGDRVYLLARIAVQPRRTDLTGCEQAIAIELARASLATDGQHEFAVTQGGARYAGSGRRALTALARLWRMDEQSARWRLRRVEPGGPWPPRE